MGYFENMSSSMSETDKAFYQKMHGLSSDVPTTDKVEKLSHHAFEGFEEAARYITLRDGNDQLNTWLGTKTPNQRRKLGM